MPTRIRMPAEISEVYLDFDGDTRGVWALGWDPAAGEGRDRAARLDIGVADSKVGCSRPATPPALTGTSRAAVHECAANRRIMVRWAAKYVGSASQSAPQMSTCCAGSAIVQIARSVARAGTASRSSSVTGLMRA